MGRPVVSTCIAGVPELVRPGENGWLVPPGSVDHLADAMRQVIQAPRAELEAMGRLGAERARREHDIRRQMPKLEKLIQAALAERQRGVETPTVELPTTAEA